MDVNILRIPDAITLAISVSFVWLPRHIAITDRIRHRRGEMETCRGGMDSRLYQLSYFTVVYRILPHLNATVV
jgi:hypothetical protein